MSRIAIMREVSRAIATCELTHLARVSIDVAVARREHDAYGQALAAAGYEVLQLPEAQHLADSVFVEDAAVVLPEVAVLCRPGAASRRAEVPDIAAALTGRRPLVEIRAPGTLDGGDVLVLDTDVVVGDTPRSNADGVTQLRAHLTPLGYSVRSVPVTGALHLKTAVTRVAERVLLLNPAWVSQSVFTNWSIVTVDPGEPFAANALWTGELVVHSDAFPRTRARLEAIGIRVVPVPASELAKAEGGVTCCALLVE